MTGQKPMAQRMKEMLSDLQQRPGGVRANYLEKSVLKKLIKRGDAKLVNSSSHANWVNGRKRVMAGPTLAVATYIPPIVEEVDTGGPYAKRRAALAEMDTYYRGKNRGTERIIGKRKLTRIQQKKLEKKQMWEKLQKEDFGKISS